MTLRQLANPAFSTLLISMACMPVAAQTWDGGGTNNFWTTANNWNPSAVPVNNGTADIVMAGSTRLTPDLNANWSVDSLTYQAGAGNFVQGSTNASRLTLGVGGIAQNSSGTQTMTHDVVIGSPSATWNVNAGPLVVQGGISGAAPLVKNGTQPLTITGSNTYLGGTFVNAGSLRVGAGGTSGNLSANSAILNSSNATLIFDRSNSVTFAGAILGSGSVVQDGTGTLTLTGSSSFTGGVSVTRGTLAIDAGSIAPMGQSSPLGTSGTLTLGSAIGVGTIEVYGTTSVTLDRPIEITGRGGEIHTNFLLHRLTLTGLISGSGELIYNGIGTADSLTLDRLHNTFSGSWLIAGDLFLEKAGAMGSVPAVDLASGRLTLRADSGFHNLGSLEGSGNVEFANTGTGFFLGVGSNNTDTTFGGMLTGGNSSTELYKTGTGIWTLRNDRKITSAF